MQSLPTGETQKVHRPDQTGSTNAAAAPFYAIAETVSDAIALLDSECRCLYANAAWVKLFQDGADLSGTDVFRDSIGEESDRVRQALFDALRTGEGRSAKFRLRSGGGALAFESRFDALPGFECVIAVVREIAAFHQTEQELSRRVAELLNIQEIAMLGAFDWDIKNGTISWSPELRQIFGVGEDFKPTLESFGALVHPDDRDWVAQMAQNSMKSGAVYQSAYRILRPDGGVRVVEAHARLFRDGAGDPARQVGALQDVTDRKWAGEQALTTEERFRSIVENVRDFAIFLLDKAGKVTHWNLGAQRMFAYRNEEILEKHSSCFFIPEQIENREPDSQLETASVEGKFKGEGWRLRKGGSRFWAQFTVTPLLDELGGMRGYSVITQDITQRRRAEEDLRSYAERLRATSMRLVEIQETERRHLARELHDRVGQNLSAIGIDLSLAANALPADANPDLAARIEDSMALVESTVDTMRNIMRDLRPPTLDEYGLLSALRSLAEAFSRRTSIRTNVNGSDDRGRLPKSVDLAMFRIAQEALNNVARHSRASQVDVTVEIDDRPDDMRLTLAITDNGVGFDRGNVESQAADSRWGLLIMRERAEAIGARLSLNTSIGDGVQVFVEYRC